MIPIKLDPTNIALLLAAGVIALFSLIFPAFSGAIFIAVAIPVLIAFIRTVYLNSGPTAAIVMSIIILLIPVGMYVFYLSLKK